METHNPTTNELMRPNPFYRSKKMRRKATCLTPPSNQKVKTYPLPYRKPSPDVPHRNGLARLCCVRRADGRPGQHQHQTDRNPKQCYIRPSCRPPRIPFSAARLDQASVHLNLHPSSVRETERERPLKPKHPPPRGIIFPNPSPLFQRPPPHP